MIAFCFSFVNHSTSKRGFGRSETVRILLAGHLVPQQHSQLARLGSPIFLTTTVSRFWSFFSFFTKKWDGHNTTAVLHATSSYTCPFRHDKWSQVFVSMGSATLAVYPILCYQQQLAYSLNFAVLLCRTSRNDELAHTRTRLYRHRFIPHLAYSVWYSVLPTKSSLLTKPL